MDEKEILDLKRNSEDLEEFKVCWENSRSVAISAHIDSANDIWIENTCLSIKKAKDFHQMLGQLITTAKRRQLRLIKDTGESMKG